MTITIAGTGNGSLNNLALSGSTGTILDSSGQGADTWYLNTNHTTNADITAWTRLTSDNGGNIGSAMSVSSGIFTFPSTGVWLVLTTFAIVNNSTAGDDSYIFMNTTSDNFSTTNTGLLLARLFTSGIGSLIVTGGNFMFDCTDTANDKVKWTASSFSSGNFIEGLTGNYRSWVHFVRLGDT